MSKQELVVLHGGSFETCCILSETVTHFFFTGNDHGPFMLSHRHSLPTVQIPSVRIVISFSGTNSVSLVAYLL